MKRTIRSSFNLRCARWLSFAVLVALSCRAQTVSDSDKKDIQNVLDKQVVAWNRGDVPGFMAGYWQSPNLIYQANESVVHGWQSLLDRYQQSFHSPNGPEMGKLALNTEEFTAVDENVVLVWGIYGVTTSDGNARSGSYTLVMRKLSDGWRTVYDRTSSKPLPQK